MVVGEAADSLGVVGEDFLALEGDEVIEGVYLAAFCSESEGADHSEGGEEVCDGVLSHELDES